MYGASPDSVAWFRSYLEERGQYVKLRHITSEPRGYCRGQSSVQFFFSYLWTICLYIWTTRPLIYMLTIPPCPWVQTGIISPTSFPGLSPTRPTELRRAGRREPWERGCNITPLTQALSNDLENIEKWSTENKMYINKTKALLVDYVERFTEINKYWSREFIIIHASLRHRNRAEFSFLMCEQKPSPVGFSRLRKGYPV